MVSGLGTYSRIQHKAQEREQEEDRGQHRGQDWESADPIQ